MPVWWEIISAKHLNSCSGVKEIPTLSRPLSSAAGAARPSLRIIPGPISQNRALMGNNPSASSSGHPSSSKANTFTTGDSKQPPREKGGENRNKDISSNTTDVKPEKEETAIRHVTFWRNGFQFGGTGKKEIDDKLNSYDDEENGKVLEEILQG